MQNLLQLIFYWLQTRLQMLKADLPRVQSTPKPSEETHKLVRCPHPFAKERIPRAEFQEALKLIKRETGQDAAVLAPLFGRDKYGKPLERKCGHVMRVPLKRLRVIGPKNSAAVHCTECGCRIFVKGIKGDPKPRRAARRTKVVVR